MATPSITWAVVVAIAPELSSVSSESRAAFLGMADRQVANSDLGDRAQDLKAYLAAHLATLAKRGGASAGPLTSKTVGPVSLSYAAPSSSAGLDSTPYGQEYQRLLASTPVLRLPVFC